MNCLYYYLTHFSPLQYPTFLLAAKLSLVTTPLGRTVRRPIIPTKQSGNQLSSSTGTLFTKLSPYQPLQDHYKLHHNNNKLTTSGCKQIEQHYSILHVHVFLMKKFEKKQLLYLKVSPILSQKYRKFSWS